MPRVSRSLVVAFVFAVPLFAGIGCGQKGPALYPVTGKVTLADGRPIERATVVLHPVGGAGDAVKPRGTVAADGTFTLTSLTTGDGAPAGEYRVTVELWLAGSRPDDPPVNRLPAKFADPGKSGLTVTVNQGPTELKPLVVSYR